MKFFSVHAGWTGWLSTETGVSPGHHASRLPAPVSLLPAAPRSLPTPPPEHRGTREGLSRVPIACVKGAVHSARLWPWSRRPQQASAACNCLTCSQIVVPRRGSWRPALRRVLPWVSASLCPWACSLLPRALRTGCVCTPRILSCRQQDPLVDGVGQWLVDTPQSPGRESSVDPQELHRGR